MRTEEAVAEDREGCQVQLGKQRCSSLATPSASPLFGTVQIISQVGKFMLLWAELDPGSPCTIISRKFLAMHLPNTPVDPLQKLLSTCGATPIRSLEVTVGIKACLGNWG